MQLIVSVCRTLANRRRLRLLHAVHEEPDRTVETLAAATGLPLGATSRHLRMLQSYQLVQAQPSGRYVRYAPARPYASSTRFIQDMQALLRDVLGADKPERVLAAVGTAAGPASWAAVYEALFKMFTAYTHLRRLMLLRYLTRRGACTVEQLCEQLKMSKAAAHRHLRKLRRRALVNPSQAALLWSFAPQTQASGQQRLLTCVVRALQATPAGK
jgi:DNA-binding IclR family transcriptional regulator